MHFIAFQGRETALQELNKQRRNEKHKERKSGHFPFLFKLENPNSSQGDNVTDTREKLRAQATELKF